MVIHGIFAAEGGQEGKLSGLRQRRAAAEEAGEPPKAASIEKDRPTGKEVGGGELSAGPLSRNEVIRMSVMFTLQASLGNPYDE